METSEKKSASRICGAIAVVAAALALSLACWGCAPKQASEAGGESESAPISATSVYPDFTDNDSGMFPDTYMNTDMLNTGNRGCNSCHTDLFDKMNGKEGYKHILQYVGFDKNGTYKDCEPCHRGHMSLTGPYFGDAIHASHYSSTEFVDVNGNCWSCHAVDSDGGQGDYQFLLWDDFYETAAVGGYVWAADDASTRDWVASRGYEGGYLTEMTLDADPQVEASFAQDITDPEDIFIVHNWDNDAIDLDAAASEDNTLSITGVNNPRTFTVDEIRAMPQVEFTAQQSCATNGEGGALMGNIPMKGVPLSYIVEQCGGLVEGTNAINAAGHDGWAAFPPMDFELSLLYEDTYVVTQFYGENLDIHQGSPLLLVPCGMPGAQWVKHLATVDFKVADTFMDAATFAVATEPSPKVNVNGMWFQNNGGTYKVGETATLTGACCSWSKIVGELDVIRFSFDMGETWVEYDVSEEIADFDGYQWVNYSLDWTPAKTGKYQVKLDAIDTEGNHISNPVTLFLTVEE